MSKPGDPDYFCQWCYDKGLRYVDDGLPWRHAKECPRHRQPLIQENDPSRLRADQERLVWIIKQAGHFQDDSFTSVSLHGDDATLTWHLTIGGIRGYGRTIREAIDDARSKENTPHLTAEAD